MMSQRMVSVISIDDMFEDLSHQPESFNVVHTVNEYTGQGAAPSSATHATNGGSFFPSLFLTSMNTGSGD